MAHFFGWVRGRGNEVTRVGLQSSGLRAAAMGWNGMISVSIWHNDGKDYFAVNLDSHPASHRSDSILLASGELDVEAVRKDGGALVALSPQLVERLREHWAKNLMLED